MEVGIVVDGKGSVLIRFARPSLPAFASSAVRQPNLEYYAELSLVYLHSLLYDQHFGRDSNLERDVPAYFSMFGVLLVFISHGNDNQP